MSASPPLYPVIWWATAIPTQAFSERRKQPAKPLSYADVLVELTQMTFRKLLPTLVFGSLGLVGAAAMLAFHYGDIWLWWQTGAIAVFALSRVAVVADFTAHADRPLTLRRAARLQRVYSSLSLGFASALAVSTLYNFLFHDFTAWLFCIFSVFSLCANLSGRIGLHPRLVQAAGTVMMAALAVGVLLLPTPLARFGVVLVVLFGVVFVRSVEERFGVIVEQVRSRRTLRQLAEQDSLTSLSNRRHFEASLEAACHAEVPVAILFIDLDRFKEVNDTYGHAAGDITLQRVAARLRASVRRGDVVARLGGDEFAILQGEGASQVAAESLARRIVRALAAPFEIDGRPITIGASIGIRVATVDDKEPAVLLSEADAAQYRVKQAGGGQFGSAA